MAPVVLLGALGAACGGHKSVPPATALCQLPAPQASALPTVTPTSVPSPLTQAVAIAFGVKTTGDQISFQVPAGTASVDIVEQAASSAVPLTVQQGTFTVDNEPIPLTVAVTGVGTVFDDVDMPPPSTLRLVNGIHVLDPLNDPSLSVYYLSFYASAWTGSLTLPNTTTVIPGTVAPAGVPAGTWTVTVSDWAHECRTIPALGCTAPTATPSTYDVKVILKPVAAPASALKVVFYLVTNTSLNATDANLGNYPDLVRLQWAMTQILTQAGITPAFQYRDVPADVRTKFATGVDANHGGVCGDMDQLLQLAEAGNQLNVFLVDLIKDTSLGAGFTTVGLDPIVPGAASFGGTPASGVLVSIVNLGKARSTGCLPGQLSIGNCGDDVTAAIVAHEAGHFMGLYHDTDSLGTIVDPIADTPTCLCPLCKAAASTQACQGLGTTDPNVASPYQMLVTDCLAPAGSTPECGGGDNLMFWLLDVGSAGVLSPGQAAVMRASPIVE